MGEYLSLIYYLFIINDSMTITTIIIIHYLFIYSLFLFNSYLFNIPGAMLSQLKNFFFFFSKHSWNVMRSIESWFVDYVLIELLTWLDVIERVRSRSSTSCLKVGLWDGTACQQSLIIIYLQEEHSFKDHPKISTIVKSYHYNDQGSYSSWVHVEGRSMRWPSFSSLKSSSTGTPGYGEPPRVKISHSNTPKDHLTWRHHQNDHY